MGALERAYAIGREAGLRFVYVGNVPGNAHNGTACPHCGELLIDRQGFAVNAVRTVHGACPHCGAGLPGVGLP